MCSLKFECWRFHFTKKKKREERNSGKRQEIFQRAINHRCWQNRPSQKSKSKLLPITNCQLFALKTWCENKINCLKLVDNWQHQTEKYTSLIMEAKKFENPLTILGNRLWHQSLLSCFFFQCWFSAFMQQITAVSNLCKSHWSHYFIRDCGTFVPMWQKIFTIVSVKYSMQFCFNRTSSYPFIFD